MANSRTIVVVEDAFVRRFLHTVLERQGYDVICALPEEAHRLLGGAGLLITNEPGLFAEFAQMIPLVYVAAFPDPEMAAGFRRWEPLAKPFHTRDLLSCVNRLLKPIGE